MPTKHQSILIACYPLRSPPALLSNVSLFSDLHEIVGYRLPDVLYHCLAQGMIGTQELNTLLSGMLVEHAPLCNGETREYRQLVQQLAKVRAQTLSLLTQPLHSFYASKRVVSIAWFDPAVE